MEESGESQEDEKTVQGQVCAQPCCIKWPKKYDARTLELIDPLIDLAPIDKTPSTADLLEEGTPPSSPAPVVVSSPVVRNRAGSA